MEILFSDVFAPFTVAILLVLGFLIFEIISIGLLGTSASNFAELMLETDSFEYGAFSNWLIVRGLPLSVALVLFGGGFGISGFAIQSAFAEPLRTSIAVALALAGAYVLLQLMGKALVPLFGINTSAVSEESLVGRKARVISPKIAKGYAGEARVRDEHGQLHTVMLEPSEEDAVYGTSDELVLVARTGPARFTARLA